MSRSGIPASPHSIRTGDGTDLALWHWPAEPEPPPRGTLFLCHGLGEHGRRYGHVADECRRRGWDVWAWDHRGHGVSGGRRGHVDGFRQYVDDMYRVVSSRGDPGLPRFLLGHSMGGLISLLYLLDHPDDFCSVALSAPAVAVERFPPLRSFVAGIVSRVWPTYSDRNGLDVEGICSDSAVVEAYLDDPLVHDRVTSRWFTSFRAARDEARARIGEFRGPVSIAWGEEDPIVSPGACRRFTGQLPRGTRCLERSGDRHEILNEPGWRATLDWFLEGFEGLPGEPIPCP